MLVCKVQIYCNWGVRTSATLNYDGLTVFLPVLHHSGSTEVQDCSTAVNKYGHGARLPGLIILTPLLNRFVMWANDFPFLDLVTLSLKLYPPHRIIMNIQFHNYTVDP